MTQPDRTQPDRTQPDSHDARDGGQDPQNDPAAIGETRFQEPDGDGGAVPEGADG